MNDRLLRYVTFATVCSASCLLAFAGVSKLLAGAGTTGVALLDQVAVRRSAAVVELALACWLASGWKFAAACRSVAVAFVSFCGIATWMSLRGAASCGCFGDVEVAPAWLVAADATIAALLFVGGRPRWQPTLPWRGLGSAAVLAAAFGATQLAVEQPREVVWLQPAQWTATPPPILDDIDTSLDLRDGEWTLVFYRPHCHECLAKAAHYRQLAATGRTLFVTMPPAAEHDAFREAVGAGTFAAINERQLWFMQTPAEVRLVNGVAR